MMPLKKPPKWKRAVPIKRPDNIISSDFTEAVPFKPSYETTKEPISMFRLLAMDYQREWHVEKQQVKEVIVISNEPAFLQRRYVIRGLLRRMQQANKEEKRFIMKKFKNIPSKYMKKEEGTKKVPKEKEVSRETSKITATGVEKIRKTIPTKVENIEPCGESASNITPCSSQADLKEVCHRDDLDKRECRLGVKKTYQKEESKKVGEEISKQEMAKTEETDAPATSKKEDTKTFIVATAKTQSIPAATADLEDECVCSCSCACTAFRKAGNDSNSSSTLPEYKNVSRESVDDQINPPQKCFGKRS